jgi:FlaA1/EpsC-like NDP-sugar epimerase
MKTILITGVTISIGSSLIRGLINETEFHAVNCQKEWIGV